MRSKSLLAVVCLSSALMSPRISLAQFQEPTKEELQMTEDPKAPGAAAVYLYREETTDDKRQSRTYYERIKILTEKGEELATVHIPYERRSYKVSNIQGRTIHPDGTVIPLTTQPSDLTDLNMAGDEINDMVFTLPSVEVGSILEFRVDLHCYDKEIFSHEWIVQQRYFVHKAHYFFASKGDYIHYNEHIGNGPGVVHNGHGKHTLDITDVPPVPSEDWMPPLNSLVWRVNFYYADPTMSRAEFWQNAGKYWAKEAEKFCNPTTTLRQAAAAIVAPGDAEEQRARKLYAAVMQIDNTSFSREKSSAERKREKLKKIKAAENVWNQKSGSADDLALLYVALARAAGLHAYPMQVVNRDRATFDPDYLFLTQLDDYLVIVAIGGKEVYLDPGQRKCPFGQLHWKHTLASGLRLTDNGPVQVTTPAMPFKSSATNRDASLTIASDGSVSGSIRYVLSGPDAMYWRQLALENDQDEVKKQFAEAVQENIPDGAHTDFDHFLALDDYNVNLIAVLKITGNIGAATGKHFFLPGFFFQARTKHPFLAQDKRETPIDVHYGRVQQDEVTYHLPHGYTVESAPQAADASWPGFAVLKTSFNSTPDGAHLVRALAYNFTLLVPTDYPNLHNFFQKVAASDQQQLVLSRTAAAKGN